MWFVDCSCIENEAMTSLEEKVICYITNFSSENNLPTFQLNAPGRKLFSELKLVADNLLFIYAEAN